MPDPQQLAKIVAQHAQTAKLFGVDAVPSYRSAHSGLETQEVGAGQAPAPVTAPATEPAPSTTRAPAREAESKPESKPGPDAKAKPAPKPKPAPARASSKGEASPASQPAANGGAHPELDGIQTLDELRVRYEADAPHAGFGTTFTNIVFGDGDPAARLMFVGEAPGEEEDKTGIPFVGRAGQLLNKMITAMGLSRETVYIANVLKTRPPNNRTPTPEEVVVCAPYLYHQIRIVKPEAIVTLGRPASQLLLQTSDAMGKLRGAWHTFPPPDAMSPVHGIDPIPVMPTYHPAYLLRSYTPDNRAKVWSDLKQVMDRLGIEPQK